MRFGCAVPGATDLAEILGSDTVVLPARQAMHKRQHLIFSSDELCFVGTAKGNPGNKKGKERNISAFISNTDTPEKEKFLK